ncbi:hypothetical protein V502_02418 [Pseudogymnoascus sp. VKM F-4520 (FW-2644)]|nr:hypothetical protein V502_02418 [Pseudogymnoascus sp. VKM F-4520 (FW-2644)]
MVEDREAQQAGYVEEQRAIQEQAAQAECERQGQWVDSRIDVPSSSMSILALSSEVLVPRSVIVASPKPFTGQNPTSSEEEGQAIPCSHSRAVHSRPRIISKASSNGESRPTASRKGMRCGIWKASWICWEVDVWHTLEDCLDELQARVVTEVKSLKSIRFKPYASCMFCIVVQKVEGGECQYNGIVLAAVAAMSVAAPVEVAKAGLYEQMKALGIWGLGEGEWSKEETAEVTQVMKIWFVKKIIWGGMEASVILRVFYWLTVGLEDGVESIQGDNIAKRQGVGFKE